MKYTAEEVRARFEVHHGISWESIQTMPIGSGSRLHLESHYKRHFETWQAAYAEHIKADERAVPHVTERLVKVAENARVFVLNDAPKRPRMGEQELRHIAMRSALLAVWPNRPAQAAQSVDVEKVREVIAGLRDYDDSAFNVWADKLEAALQESKP